MIEPGDQDLFPLRVGDGAVLYVAASRFNSKSDASEVRSLAGSPARGRSSRSLASLLAN